MKGMVFESEEQTLLIDIWRGNRLGYHEEPMARVARELWQLFAKSVHFLE